MRLVLLARRVRDCFRPELIVFRRGLRDRMRVSLLVHKRCGGLVRRGPFVGMRCNAGLPDISSKVLGSYEQELHEPLARLLACRWRNVVNVGCSDGYYAVGCALRLPDTRVFAYDISVPMQALATATAALNAAAVEVGGQCTPEVLAEIAATGDTLVVCDCEGGEHELLDPALLAGVTLLVELHDVPGVAGADLVERFRATHRVSLIDSRPRDPADYDELSGLSDHDRHLAVFERPDPQVWALLAPQSEATASPE